MSEVVLGTAGHVDHGKTSFIKALTGIETDRLKEEKKRGITIELGFAFLDLPCGHRLGIVDVPGHEKFIKNMVAGAAGIDLVAFIIAADEGVMPQTREHFDICRLLGVDKGLIIITKVDMVEPDWLEMVIEDVREFFHGSFLEDAPILPVSSTTGAGIEEAKEAIDSLVRGCDFSPNQGPFRLPIDRIFSMKGFGAVVTGTAISGTLKVGDEICIYPEEKRARVRGIQVHGVDAEEVDAGRRTAINVQGLETEMIDRGDMLASADVLSPSFMLDCSFHYVSENKKPLKNRTRVRVHLGTAEIFGRIALLEVEEAQPGDTVRVQILLESPVTAWPGDHYVLRSYSPVHTIGGGAIFNPSPIKKRRRFKESNRAIFDLYEKGDLEEHALFHLSESGFHGLTFSELQPRLGLFGKRLKKILNGPISSRKILVVDSDKQRMVAEDIFLKICTETLRIVDSFHAESPLKEGISKEELRSRLFQGLTPRLFQLALDTLSQQGDIVQEQAIVRRSHHQVFLQADGETIKKEILKLYHDKGLAPPTRKELFQALQQYEPKLVQEIFDILVREAQIHKISADLSYHHEVLEGLKEKVLSFLQQEGEMGAQDFKALSGLSRKFSIPLLEYFDKLKLTIRVGDKRILR